MSGVDPQELLRAIIAAMQQEGATPTRTRLVKFLFLADLIWARYHGGATATGWNWYVDKFGPCATAALQLLDDGVAEGWLTETLYGRNEPDETGPVAKIYRLAQNDNGVPPQLPPGLGKLRSLVKKYGGDTNRLLHFTYGDTEVMVGMTSGKKIDFSKARPVVQAKSVGSTYTDRQRKRFRELMGKLREERIAAEAASTAIEGPLDEAYFRGLPREDGPTEGEVELVFEENGGQ